MNIDDSIHAVTDGNLTKLFLYGNNLFNYRKKS